MYVPWKWISDKRKNNVKSYYNITCWKNPYQEPYVIVYRNDSITQFYEGFVNYGFNKISYIETLRLDGYRFVVGGNFFAFDLPHYPLVCTSYLSRSSRFQKQHVNNRASISYMTNYYYMQKIRKRSLGKKILHPICSRYPVSSLNSSVATNSN